MEDKEKVRLIIISSILFFIFSLTFFHELLFKIFEYLFGYSKLNTIKDDETDTFNIFGKIVLGIIYAIVLLLLL